MRKRGLVRGVNILGDQRDLHSKRLLGVACPDVPFWKVHGSQYMRCKRESRLSCLELALVA
jgi:hypothetical protein